MHDQPPVSRHDGDEARSRARQIRNRTRPLLAGRTSFAVAALAVLVGLGVTGIAVLQVTGTDTGQSRVSADARNRAEAASRADRSHRQAPAIGATPPTAPSSSGPVPSPSASAASDRADATTSAPARTKTSSKPRPKPRPKKAWVSPMPGAGVTSCFGMRWGVLHAGIDLAQPADTPIHAAGAGTVVAAGWAYTGYGISVVINHGNGFLTHYAHQNRTVVQVGQKVTAGQVIGYEGSTGDSTGPHLHFEVHRGALWNQIDPASWMRARGVDLGC